VNLFWLWLILRIARNYAGRGVRQDERSDNEEDDGEDEEETSEGGKKKQLNGSADVKLLVNGHPLETVPNGNSNGKVGGKREAKKER
jgi:hypothetical protein